MLSFTLRNVLLGAMILGLTGGVLGSFSLLRRQSLLGDSLAHAALPGVVLAFLITGSKAQLGLLLGALIAGLAGAGLIILITRFSRIKEDAAFGIILSVFFGTGIVLLTIVQKLPGGNQSGLDRFLFGQAAALVQKDLYLMGGLGMLALFLVWLFFKEFKLLAFDREFGESLGYPMRFVEMLLTSLLVLVVVLGLQTVGVILMVAALVTPAAAARQWTDNLSQMVMLSGVIGALSGAAGTLISHSVPRMPTGPSIVLTVSVVFVFSLLAAPRRGLIGAWVRRERMGRRIRRENLLKDFYRLGEAKGDLGATFAAEEIGRLRGIGGAALARIVGPLVRKGHLLREGSGLRLSESGLGLATDMVRKHRLWELYLTRFLDLPSDHVHRDAEAMEHALGDEEVANLEELLGYPEIDPHGEPIPARRPA